MVVLMVETAPAGLRGELSRWMIEPRAGVFVGSVSAMVRDRLWDKVTKQVLEGGAILAYSSNTEQGFAMRICGDTRRHVVDYEGLALVRIPHDGRAAAPRLERGDNSVADDEE